MDGWRERERDTDGAAIKRTRSTQNIKRCVRHFELSWKRMAWHMCTRECMSHFVYDLRSWPLVRDPPARVRGPIASDHCTSDQITSCTQWAWAGYPFPEVNLPEQRGERKS